MSRLSRLRVPGGKRFGEWNRRRPSVNVRICSLPMHLCSAMIAVMRLARSSITVFKLRYPRPVRWKDTVEDGATFLLLRLFSDDGLEGIAEGPIKPTWTGTTRRTLVAAIEDMLLPALETTDLSDPAAVRARLDAFPENTLAKALIDHARTAADSRRRHVTVRPPRVRCNDRLGKARTLRRVGQ